MGPHLEDVSAMEIYFYSLNPALDGGEWSATCRDRFTPARAPGTYWTGAGWAPEPVWTRHLREKPVPAANRTPVSSP
jgi:hypothetical protein